LRRYGVSDLAAARRYGYHLPASGPAKAAPVPATDSAPAVRAALLGTVRRAATGRLVPAGGCVTVARRALDAPAQPDRGVELDNGRIAGLLTRIDVSSFRATLGSASLRPVLADWSSCMARRGYHFVSPLNALDAVDVAAPQPSAAEIRQAVADVQCKTSTRLVPRWAALEAPLQRRALSAAPTELQAYLHQLDRQLSAAATALDVSEIPS
jgi:hypothetical protein